MLSHGVYDVIGLTEKAHEVVVVILAQQCLVRHGVERLHAVVPDCLATLGGTDLTWLTSAALLIHDRWVGLTAQLEFVVLLDHGPLLAWNTESFPQETLRSNDEVCEKLGKEHTTHTLRPDLALLCQSLDFAQSSHVVSYAEHAAEPCNESDRVAAATSVVQTVATRAEGRWTNVEPVIECMRREVRRELVQKQVVEVLMLALAEQLPSILIRKTAEGSNLELKKMVLSWV